jgi:hypothetical protein
MKQKTKTMLRWIPSLIVCLQIGVSASMKLSGNPFMVQNFEKVGLQYFMNMIAWMELLFLFLFMWKQSLRIGFLLLTAYYGGAIAIEMIYGNLAIPAAILTVIWIAAYLREPMIFKMQQRPLVLPASA